jgi:hypothetical protein
VNHDLKEIGMPLDTLSRKEEKAFQYYESFDDQCRPDFTDATRYMGVGKIYADR